MTFRQILSQYSSITSKNQLNKLLAEVERNFGVFSRDMELDIRANISVPVIIEYFDRIIHDEHPKLEHDKQVSEKKSHSRSSCKQIPKIKGIKPITYGKELEELNKKRSNEQKDISILKKLAKNGRDYSKPTLESELNSKRDSDRKENKRQWVKIVSIPMGGMNKKH